MDTATIRKKLHSYLEIADDKKVKAIYTMMETEIESSSLIYSDNIKTDIDMRYANYKTGKAKTFTADESKKRIQKILSNNKKK